MKSDNQIVEKSLNFAVRIVKLCRCLNTERSEYVLSRQLLKSGTSIGANVREALRGQSRKDFAAKMNIALKEVEESGYWLELLYKTDYISDREFDSIFSDCKEITRILMSIVKSAKND